MVRNDCLLQYKCKTATDCKQYCYPYQYLKVLQSSTGIPLMYSHTLQKDLPYRESNVPLYEATRRYSEDILARVGKGQGLYFVGTVGTGKTLTVCTLANEYLIARVIEHCKKVRAVSTAPVTFQSVQKLQESYNAQFRFKSDELALQYYELKVRLSHTELLILDDLAIRGMTEAFEAEMFNILDTRLNARLATLITSNMPYANLEHLVGERILSRIKGLCGSEVVLTGTDWRSNGLWER